MAAFGRFRVRGFSIARKARVGSALKYNGGGLNRRRLQHISKG